LGCPFGGAGAIEVDDPQETLDDKKEGVAPGAVDGEKPRAEEGHKFIVIDRAGKGNRCIVGEGNGWGSQWMERQGGQDRAVGTVGWKTGA
jgi:hypothetical protein